MRRGLVSQWGHLAARHLPLGLSLHQHGDTAGQHGNLSFLPGDDVGQVLNRADKVGEAFFMCGNIGHMHTKPLVRPCARVFCECHLPRL